MNLVYTSRFKKDFKQVMKRNKNEGQLYDVVSMLLENKPLPLKYKDHSLGGQWTNKRECHIEPDWLLIYCIRENDLILERTGSHSDLFK